MSKKGKTKVTIESILEGSGYNNPECDCETCNINRKLFKDLDKLRKKFKVLDGIESPDIPDISDSNAAFYILVLEYLARNVVVRYDSGTFMLAKICNSVAIVQEVMKSISKDNAVKVFHKEGNA